MIYRPLNRYAIHRDPADWAYHVRRSDHTWLCRPAPVADAPPSNADTWSRRIPDCWSFDTEAEARAAAIAHGAAPDDFKIVPSPRRGGEWLKGEGAYSPREADDARPLGARRHHPPNPR